MQTTRDFGVGVSVRCMMHFALRLAVFRIREYVTHPYDPRPAVSLKNPIRGKWSFLFYCIFHV